MNLTTVAALAKKLDDADFQGKLDIAWRETLTGAALTEFPVVADFIADNESENISLADVHRFVNGAIEYQHDEPGVDHWQSAQETLHRRAGDCEDVALLCAAVGRHLGLIDHCTIDIVKDHYSGQLHAVLTVAESTVLDNKSSRPVPLDKHREFYKQPIIRLAIPA